MLTHHSPRFRSLSLCAAFVAVGMCVSACGPAGTDAPTSPATSAGAWDLRDAAPNTDDGIRILLYHDMEGLSGQDDPWTFLFGHPEYVRGRELLAADVNAVAEGLFAGGATEVHIVDGHGSGNPEPDLLRELLDPRVQQVFRDSTFDAYVDLVDLVEPGLYDAVGVVGMHAKTGSGGFASHTFTLGIEFVLNDQSITETELVALSWGRVDVPLIFASGDDRLGSDLETMPWIEYVEVKEATSASTAIPRPLEEARDDLRQSAARAVENLASAKVMKLRAPVRATMRAVHPASLAHLAAVPGLEYADNSVSFSASGFRETYDGLLALVGVATRGYFPRMLEIVAAQPNGREMRAAWTDSLIVRWLDVESGRWEAASPAATATDGIQYHGFR